MIGQNYNIRFGRISYSSENIESAASEDKSNIPKGDTNFKADLSTDTWKTLLSFFINKKILGEFSTLSTIWSVIIYYFNNIIIKVHLITEENDTSFSIKKILKWKFINIKNLNSRRYQMKLYGGIDLHSNNNYLGIINEENKRVYRQKLSNNLDLLISVLRLFKENLVGVVVESTYNWYWLVDGLMVNGYRIHLANPSAIKQYEGLKYSDDTRDSFWLAQMLQLNILPEGYIYPKEERPIRDLLRKRGKLVRERTSHILSFKSMVSRNLGVHISGEDVKKLNEADIKELFKRPQLQMSAKSSISMIKMLTEHIHTIEKEVKGKIKIRKEFQLLQSVPGIGDVLALTIMLEVGDIKRFPEVGNYSSYCHCVSSTRVSNDKKKGKGNSRNGNRYLAWAYVEAAHYAKRYCANAQKFYQRKRAKRMG